MTALSAPLDAALRAAQSDLATTPVPGAPGPAVEWTLPSGDHPVTGPLLLGVPGRALRLVGTEGCTLHLTGGDLTVVGTQVSVERVALRGGALRVQGDDVEVTAIAVTGSAPAAGEGVGVALAATSSAAASNVRVSSVSGTRAVGVQVVAPSARLSMVTATDVVQTGGGSPGGPAIDGLDAAGVLVEASRQIDATSLTVRAVKGRRAAGVRLVCAGEGPVGAPGWVYAVDLSVRTVGGAESATGVLAISGGLLRLRGFLASGVTGHDGGDPQTPGPAGDAPAGRAAGVLALGVRGLDVSVGRVEAVTAAPGADAVGARLLGGSNGAATVSDMAVEATGCAGSGGPLSSEPPDWGGWAAAATDLGAGNVALGSAPGAVTLPAVPTGAAVVGLHVTALVSAKDPTALSVQRPALTVTGATVRRTGGASVWMEGGMRAVLARRIEAWAAARAGLLSGEQVLAAELTLDTLDEGLRFGPGDVSLFDAIFTRISSSPSFVLDPDAVLGRVAAAFTGSRSSTEDPHLQRLDAIPYLAPGALPVDAGWASGVVPPAPPQAIDLSLLAAGALPAALAGAAERVPGDPPGVAFIGATPPDAPPRADARDPETRPAPTRVVAASSSPITSYTARDAASLLSLMTARVQAVMPSWTVGGPADFTTVILELLAERLDHLAYMQERAVSEGYLGAARRRRSVEDHARVLDCRPDPGLSATAMIRFRLDPTLGKAFTVPADTLVANRTADEAAVVFATEQPLAVIPELDTLRLAQACAAGDVSALVAEQPGLGELAAGRWLAFTAEDDPHHAGHVVRITVVERAGDVTRVRWDPRRPLPSAFAAPGGSGEAPVALILGNVVPAHHGVPLWQLDDQTADIDPILGRWRQLLTVSAEGAPGLELPLPLAPLSVQASGYPLPDAPARDGTPALRVSVDRVEWRLVDDLSLAGPGDQVVVIRPADDGGTVLRFGDDVNGTSLPPRPVRIDLDMRVGMGTVGNVGVDQLTRIIQLGGALGPAPSSGPDPLSLLSATNPLPAVEGRDPEPIDHLRYRAPLGVMDVRSGVTPADCERLLGALSEVRAARAQVIEGGLRPLFRMTVLLRDDDLLGDDERLRRFADVRRALEDARLLGFDVEAVPPTWVPLDLDAVVDADPHHSAGALRDSVIEAVAGPGGMLDPDVIGLGRDVQLSTLYRSILAVPGVAGAVVDRFRRLEPGAVDRLADGTIPVGPHEVPVIRAPARSGVAGLFTVTVRGGLQ